MRIFPFFLSVSLAGAAGTFVVAVLVSTVLNERQTVYDAAAGLLYLLAIGSPAAAAVMVAYGLFATVIARVLRRPVWWVGLLSGLIPALVMAVIFSSPSEGIGHSYATADEMMFANRVNAAASAFTIIWCTVSAAVLLPVTARASRGTSRPLPGQGSGTAIHQTEPDKTAGT